MHYCSYLERPLQALLGTLKFIILSTRLLGTPYLLEKLGTPCLLEKFQSK